MASTYSDLKIELIGTGEQVGTWGNTTNTNLGTAIEEAITGSATVTFSSADETLTLSNTNGTQTARNLRLVCTGTSGGARNLILGSGCQIEKLYLIQNDLADAVTVKNTTGTGVTIPAGRKQFVFNDGTNVVEATSSVVDLTTDVTGTLPIANGGTGSTSTTFCSLTTNVTGTLPVANGGTGAATLTANNVLLGNNTSAVQFVAPGSNGNILTSDGTTWVSSSPVPVVIFPAATAMLFVQTNAPTGWTKSATHNNKALRVVSGTASSGGSVAFTTAFASQAVSGTVGLTTLTTSEIPSHTHTMPWGVGSGSSGYVGSSRQTSGFNFFPASGATGGGGSHDHTFTGTAIDLAVQYVDVIIATKD